MPLPITEVFADLPDPRRDPDNKRFSLTDILTLAVCAVIGGAENGTPSPSTASPRSRSLAGVSGTAQRRSQPRHVRPRLRPARPRALAGRFGR